MDKATILAMLDFSRMRLLGILEAIEKSGHDVSKVLAWRPGPGRAHIAWQAMHCAATHDRYLHVNLLQQPVADEALVSHFAGGSTPSDQHVPALPEIRQQLERHYQALRQWVEKIEPAELSRQFVGRDGKSRSVFDALVLMAWHEAHHQGQIHLTWNLYKAAHA